MAELSTTNQWIQFFKDSGLPTSVSANYAIIFVENRIQSDMLMDLSKEYLYDMGIRVMGDVIAILKHAKEYHAELVKQRMIPASSPPRNSSTSISTASRMLGRLTRPATSSVTKAPHLVSTRLTRSPAVAHTVSTVRQPSVISLKKHHLEDSAPVMVKRVRRVLPEEEGGYLIKMPSGSTQRTKQILQNQTLQTMGTKKSVFDRLGDSDVSSSTDIPNSKIKTSVFDRLGLSSEVPTSTMSAGKNLSLSDQPLQYQGVLKTTTATRALPPKTISVTRSIVTTPDFPQSKRIVFSDAKDIRLTGINRINEILQRNAAARSGASTQQTGMRSESIMNAGNGSTGQSVLNRLGTKVIPAKMSITNRLGTRFGEKSEISVFSRLGKTT